MKTATISFGQSMPINEMRRAEKETLAGGLVHRDRIISGCLSGGWISRTGQAERAALVILNLQETGLDGIADLVLNRPIGETLGAVVGRRLGNRFW